MPARITKALFCSLGEMTSQEADEAGASAWWKQVKNKKDLSVLF
jgi:hypothetical protein